MVDAEGLPAGPVVDAWMQHPTVRFLREDMFASLHRWTGAAEPTGELPLDATVRALDDGGVDRGLICAWYGPAGPLISNDEVDACVRARPDRFRGVASVDIRYPIAAIGELRRAVQDLGFVALRIVPWLWGLPPNDRRYYPLFATCVELGIPLCTQVGHTGPLRTSETGRPIPYLDDVALEFPELVIVAGHIGYPWTNEMIALATKYPNVYIDTSAYAAHRYPPELVTYLREHGQAKVLFGTNYPMITPRRALERLGELGLDSEARAAFLGGNATRVFRI
ncbi:amidohydrolase 2 [Parafrankia sp. EAN1pec]|nr:amidohydrolase 2 [Frankia sp. EAN1pec]